MEIKKDNFNILFQFQDHTKAILEELWNSKDMTDVTLVCDDNEQIQAHKIVLIVCCQVFRDIYNKLPNNSVFNLKGIKLKDLKALLQLMYLGYVNVQKDEIENLNRIAKKLNCEATLRNCKILEENTTVDNIINLKTVFESQNIINVEDSNNDNLTTIEKQVTYEEYSREDNTLTNLDNHETNSKIPNDGIENEDETINKNNVFKCGICSHKSDTKDGVEEHFQIDHELSKDGTRNSKCKIMCFKCEREFPFNLYTKHMKLTHNESPDIYPCSKCGHQSDSEGSSYIHFTSTHRNFQCKECDYKSYKIVEFKRHLMLKHDGTKFTCKLCDFYTPMQRYLRRHMKQNHDESRKVFACDKCPYISREESNLKDHKRRNMRCRFLQERPMVKEELKENLKTNTLANRKTIWLPNVSPILPRPTTKEESQSLIKNEYEIPYQPLINNQQYFQIQQIKQDVDLMSYPSNTKTTLTIPAQQIVKRENNITNQQNIMAVPIIYNEKAFQIMKNNQKFPPNQPNVIPNSGQNLYILKQESGMVPLFTPVDQTS